MKLQNLNTQPSVPSVTHSKGSSHIDEMESSTGHKWGSSVSEKSMILTVTYFNLAQFVSTMGVLPEFQLYRLDIAHWLTPSKTWKVMLVNHGKPCFVYL